MIPYVEGKTVLQVAENEMELLDKIEGMMLMVTFVALAASGFGVMTTMTTSVIERTKEIGLMKAIGARSRRIAGLFFAEALIIGATGGVIGYGTGLVFAQFIGLSVFGAPVSIQPVVFPITMGIAIGITLAGSALPVRRSLRIDPAKVLRGE
jgi:putative ABC transport system permease protein